MIRTDNEIEALASNGTPVEIADAMAAYENRIRALEARALELEVKVCAALLEVAEADRLNPNIAAMVVGLDMIHNALHNKG